MKKIILLILLATACSPSPPSSFRQNYTITLTKDCKSTVYNFEEAYIVTDYWSVVGNFNPKLLIYTDNGFRMHIPYYCLNKIEIMEKKN